MLEVVSAFVFGELVEDATAQLPELVDRPGRAIAEEFLEFGEGEFDRVQIGRVRRQVAQLGANGFDRFANSRDLVAGEIVHHDKITRLERGSQMLSHPAQKQRAIDRPIDGQWSDESFGTHCAEKGCRLPAAVGSFLHQARAKLRATIATRHVGFRPRFVDEDDCQRIDLLLRGAPLDTFLDNVGAILFAGDQRLFFRDCSSARQALQSVIKHTVSPRSSFSAACNSRR